jgi:hypothetical protein
MMASKKKSRSLPPLYKARRRSIRKLCRKSTKLARQSRIEKGAVLGLAL